MNTKRELVERTLFSELNDLAHTEELGFPSPSNTAHANCPRVVYSVCLELIILHFLNSVIFFPGEMHIRAEEHN